jgi:hypothetical protein
MSNALAYAATTHTDEPPGSDFTLDCFVLRTWARARLYAEGVYDLHEAVDGLAADAARDGISTDTAQRVMAAEFGAVR